MKRLSASQLEEHDNAIRCYICRHELEENEAKGYKVRNHDFITGWLIGGAYGQGNLERQVSFKIPEFFYNFRGFNAHLIVHVFEKRPDREIKVIGTNMKVHPGRVGKEHSLPGIALILACFPGAVYGLVC